MAESIPSYDELQLRVVRGNGSYRVHARGPDGSFAECDFELPFSETELDNFVLRVGRPRHGVRAYRSSQMEEAKGMGSRLFASLVRDDVREVYLTARTASESRERGLRVTLCLTGVPELMGVPWEFLYERPNFLSQSIWTPVVRSLDQKKVRAPREVTLPLQILGVISRPDRFDNLDVDAERAKLDEALREPTERGLVRMRWLSTATLGELERTVGAPDDIHVLHFIGHGVYDERSDSGILIFEDERGGPQEVTGEDLGSLIHDERSLRLAVLNSCEGARNSHVDPFSGVATSLIERGLPAVIGMQFEITDGAAVTFAERLYTALGEGFPVDAALAHARKAIFAAGNDVEFGTPVLFLRTTDAQLFHVRGGAEPAVPGDFSVDLEQDPPDAAAGTEVSLKLSIVNTGGTPLTDVVARRADGTPLDEPGALPAGGSHVIRWREVLEPDATRLVTVTACDVNGSRIAEQVAARARPAGGLVTVHEAPRERQQTVAIEPMSGAQIAAVGAPFHKSEKARLLEALRPDEPVFKILIGNRDGKKAGLVAVTARRLLWTTATDTAEWPLDRVGGVETEGGLWSRLKVELGDGEQLEVKSFANKANVVAFGQVLEHAREHGGRIARAAPAASGNGWTSQVVHRGDGVRTVRVRLDHEEHVVKYTIGLLKDSLEVDGEALYSIWVVREDGYELALTDGGIVRTGLCKISVSPSGRKITELALSVEGQLLYRG